MMQRQMIQTNYPRQPHLSNQKQFNQNQFTPTPPPPAEYLGIEPFLQGNPSIVQKIRDKLDVDGDGNVDLDDAMAFVDKLTEPKYKCSECGKGLKKKSKYGTELCVECYRNPSDEARCIGTVSNGNRCKRRKHTDSEKGYCGIHMKKYAEPLPFKE